MERQRLQQLEEQCIQDQPPACTAACPVHVDARALAAAARDGDFDEAHRLLARAVPFPRVIARCCDAPCQTACVREQAGGGIRIRDLERAAVDYGERPAASTAARRSKPGRVAVVGAGLSGLTAAHDLAAKGCEVVVFEAEAGPGGRARELPEQELPLSVLESDCRAVTDAGAALQLFTPVALERGPAQTALAALAPGYDAVYLAAGGAEASAGAALGLEVDEDGVIVVDPVTLETSEPGVYAGGSLLRPRASWSPISSIGDGRRAAVSIDRQLQRVSLSGSRADRGSFETRLVTSLEDVTSEAPVAAADVTRGYSGDEAAAEGRRCLQCECLECVKACAYLEAFGGHPGRYVRRIYNNLTVTKGTRQANTMIDSCSLCRLCYEVCPTDLDMAEVNRAARREMVRQGKMPPSAFGFALQDMRLAVSDEAALVRPAPGMEESEAVFFPGCQLSASDPDVVERTYAYLLDQVSPTTGLALFCCGAPADWAGETALFERTLAGLRERLGEIGARRLILACPTCETVFSRHLPGIETTSLWEVMLEAGLPPAAAGSGRGRRVAVHDSCTARYQSGVQGAVRSILEACGCEIDELRLSRERTECCGFGGLMLYANPEIGDAVVNRRIDEGDQDYVAYCAMCRDRFAAKGKRTVHVLDLLFGGDYDEHARRPGPGLTLRSDQRVALKRSLLAGMWQEPQRDREGWRDVLTVPEVVGDVLEQRFIRPDEVHQVVAAAEETGSRFVEPASGHLLASLRLGSVTYWAEYSREGDRFRVHDAYSHRMEVGPPGASAQAAETVSLRVWRCARDGRDLEPRTVTVSYLGAGFPVGLLCCPDCGLVLVSEELALGRMLQVERAMEDK